MSILIKGMELPKEGTVLVIDSCGEVWSNTWPTRGYIRVNKAKAVEVLTPHGDLIDRKKLLDNAGGVYTARPDEAQKIQHEINKVLFAIKDAPAVIEAEEGALNSLDKEGEAGR